MKEFNELMKTAQECANEADALRKCVTEISFKVGEIANILGTGYNGQLPENMKCGENHSSLGFTKRIIVGLLPITPHAKEWQIAVEVMPGLLYKSQPGSKEIGTDVYFRELGCVRKRVCGMSILDMRFVIDKISDFLNEWYVSMKRMHSKRRVIHIAAEKIVDCLKIEH